MRDKESISEESDYKVYNVQGYIAVIESIIDEGFAFCASKNKLWYRGTYKTNYSLHPNVFRKYENGSINSSYSDTENQISDEFKRRAYLYFENPLSDDDYKEWLNIIQHYGAPTRLLDWSENCLVALYFAVVDKNMTGYEDAAVWVLNPNRYYQKVNSIESNSNRLIRDNYAYAFNKSKGINMTDYPCLIFPKYLDNRMQAQSSRFLLWGKNEEPLDEINEIGFNMYTKEMYENCSEVIKSSKHWENPLFKVTINGASKDKIRKQLDNCGINYHTLFPGLDSLGITIKDKWKMDLDDIFG
jgi:hypothetical protein